MKKHLTLKKILLPLLLSAALIGSLSACGNKQTAENTEETKEEEELPVDIAPEDRLNVAISLPKETPYNKKLATELTNKLWQRGYNIILRYAEGSPSKQAEQITELVNSDIKCLIVCPADGENLDIDSLNSENIPLINIDVPIMNAENVNFYVGYDNVKAGENIADYIISKKELSVNKNVTIELLFGEADPVSKDIYTGVMNKLNPYFESGALICRSSRTTFESCSTTADSAVAVLNDLGRYLSGYYLDEDLQVLVTGSDYIASGACAYFLTNGYTLDEFPLVTGINGEPSAARDFEQELLSTTQFKDASKEAETCADIAKKLIEKKDVSDLTDDLLNNNTAFVPQIILETTTLTRENYIETLLNGNYYKTEDIYG